MRFIAEYLDGHFVKHPNVDYVIMRSGMIELYRDDVDTPRGTQMPFAAINVGLIAHYWLKGDSAMLKSKIEQYLSENHGDLNQFYRGISLDLAVGEALRQALSSPDQYRMRQGKRSMAFKAATEYDAPEILELLDWLKADLVNYPEDHPLWSYR